MKMRKAVHVSHMGMRNAYIILVGKPGDKETFGRLQAWMGRY
jgi:hypothetical protein